MMTMSVSLDDKYDLEKSPVMLTGNQAVIRLMLLQAARDRAQGHRTAGFVSGYRGSPLAGLDIAFQSAGRALARADIRFQPGLNEDLAATAVWGTQQIGIVSGANRDGVFGLWYGKGPGVDRSGDALKHANAAGTMPLGGVIALAGDDHVAQSSSLAHQSEFALIDASIPVFVPETLADLLEYGHYAYALSRFSGLWAGMKVTASVIETTGIVSDPAKAAFVTPGFALPPGGVHLRWPDDPLAQEARLFEAKLPAASAFLRANPLDRTILSASDDRIGILTIGKSAGDVTTALELLDIGAGDGVRVCKLATAWPPQPETLRAFARGLRQIVVVEEKRALIEDQLRVALYGTANAPAVVGKIDEAGAPLLRPTTDLDPGLVARVLAPLIAAATGAEALAARVSALTPPTASARIAARTPFFCSGCPHNRSTRVPDGSLALGGIGCHSMAMNMDRGMTAYTHMGGEGANWIGLSPFTDMRHIFQNLGDGTYFHSGALAIRAAVAAGVTMTYKILFNGAVAMTGGQPVDGELTVPVLVRQLLAEGVARIAVVSEEPASFGGLWRDEDTVELHDRAAFADVSERLQAVPGVSVLIYDQGCAAEKRRLIKRGKRAPATRRVFINERVCEGCGDCVTASNCLSVVPVETELGEKRRIDQASCNTDLSCLEGFCPSLLTVTGGRPRHGTEEDFLQDPPVVAEPELAEFTRPVRILVSGIGGTGVVTIGAILATAALIDGRGVNVLDATGMAQKGGSVWSHVALTALPGETVVARTPDRSADVAIAGDLVVAAAPASMAALRSDTRMIVNLASSPTGSQVLSPLDPLPHAALRRQLEAAVDHADLLDATALAARLAGEPMTSNMLLLGFAWQSGVIPLSSRAIEEAITLNGRDVGTNLHAFGWGRAIAADPALATPPTMPRPDLASVHAISLGGRDDLSPMLRHLALDDLPATTFVERRAADLRHYGDAAIARRYLTLLERIESLDDSTLTDLVARSFFKLLAVKDEWEVARLFTDSAFRQELAGVFEGRYRLRYHFAPGYRGGPGERHPAKRGFGGWVYPLLWIMARLRGLRGTFLDPFARTPDRRREQALPAWYEDLVETVIARIDALGGERAAALLSLPLSIRGYGPVKMRSVEVAMAEAERLLADELSAPRVAA